MDKCDRCHVDANCIGKGVCVCKEGYRGDGVHHCEKTSKLQFFHTSQFTFSFQMLTGQNKN